jgi:hypothetical protein
MSKPKVPVLDAEVVARQVAAMALGPASLPLGLQNFSVCAHFFLYFPSPRGSATPPERWVGAERDGPEDGHGVGRNSAWGASLSGPPAHQPPRQP